MVERSQFELSGDFMGGPSTNFVNLMRLCPFQPY